MATKFPNKAAQRAARRRVEKATEEIIDRALSQAFNQAIWISAKENPHSHSGHFVRLFARAIWERTGKLYGHRFD